MNLGSTFLIEVNPNVPKELSRLSELANDLWYSWDKPTRQLFARLHPNLWRVVGRNPKTFLRRVSEARLQSAALDKEYLTQYQQILETYDNYKQASPPHPATLNFAPDDLIAYFCAEFGFHESFPIYSGGLGILAGDHCKAASDMQIPFVGVGLLYRQGYFSQRIDGEGNQLASYQDSDFDDLPILPVMGADGKAVQVAVSLPQRSIAVKVWQAQIGRVRLFLLDTNLDENLADDREITHQLYGGDRNTRILQELILGVGGVKALAAMNLRPTVWHINEGHAAFLVLERARVLVEGGMEFCAALEAVAVNTVFTTHTPVPAGHDHFPEHMMRQYFDHFYPQLGLTLERFLSLGRVSHEPDFNMTVLALRGSRYQNGVSKIHGEVSAQICAHVWPELQPHENPISYVTNGIHVPTFLAQEWADIFNEFCGPTWREQLGNTTFWARLYELPDEKFWEVRQQLKSAMLEVLRFRLRDQHLRNNVNEAHIDRLLRYTHPKNPDILTVGFARRFATYKRATLLFKNLDWLREILRDPERPVLFIFAGKAHPQDHPGQDLIRQIHHLSQLPEFLGKILLVENYDMGLARHLVSGVDVWLNTPVYPLEASGTSGMKAGINGVLNLSVLDGWWGEGYDGTNGWAIKPAPQSFDDHRRDEEDARTLYELLQDQVIPLYYDNADGYPKNWIKKSKHAMASLMPVFNSRRMVGEYAERYYLPATAQGKRYAENDFESATKVAHWKAMVRKTWPSLTIRRLDTPTKHVHFGEALHIEVALQLNGLQPEDVKVELLLAYANKLEFKNAKRYKFTFLGLLNNGEHLFSIKIAPELCGKLGYKVRVAPNHELLTHTEELGLVLWL